jgi:hypothetical protein
LNGQKKVFSDQPFFFLLGRENKERENDPLIVGLMSLSFFLKKKKKYSFRRNLSALVTVLFFY